MAKISVLWKLGKSIVYKNIALYSYIPQNKKFRFGLVWFMVFNATFNSISVIVAVSFIDGGNRGTQRKPLQKYNWFSIFLISAPFRAI